MAFVVSCDVCAAEIESGDGWPVSGYREAYCTRCSGIVSAAKRQAREWAIGEAERTYEQMKAKEAEYIREWLAKKPDDTAPRAGIQEWPAIENPGSAS